MNEAIECLKLYMNNRKIGNSVSQEYIDMVNLLIESCVQLQAQLKDKDEKISKAIEFIKENEYFDFDYNSYQLNNYKNIKYILESNKED